MGFPTTRWSLILGSRQGGDARREALEALFTAYWKPLYFYIRRKGRSIEASKDAVQGLYARLIESDFLGRLDPAQGRFRSYLRAAADRHLANEHEAAVALKRGGGATVVSLDFEAAEREMVHAPAEAASAFDREWILGILERASAKLRREFETTGRRGSFDTAMKFFGPGEAPSYAEGAAACGMGGVQFKAFLHRTRRRFQELVREEVAETTDEADGELQSLIAVLKP